MLDYIHYKDYFTMNLSPDDMMYIYTSLNLRATKLRRLKKKYESEDDVVSAHIVENELSKIRGIFAQIRLSTIQRIADDKNKKKP